MPLRIKDYDKFEGCTLLWPVVTIPYSDKRNYRDGYKYSIEVEGVEVYPEDTRHPNALLIEDIPSLLADHKEMRELIKVLAGVVYEVDAYFKHSLSAEEKQTTIENISQALVKLKEFETIEVKENEGEDKEIE